MEKPQKIIKLTRDIAEPLVCKDRDDFTKYFFSLAMIFAKPQEENTENKAFIIEGMQMLMHEYMALVFSGKMEPYRMKFSDEEDKEESIKAFREGMLQVTERLMNAGVPMKEEDGKFSIEFDDLKKEFENGKD